MSTSKYLVTGGGGYLGRNLVKSLLSDGHQILIIARKSYPELQELGVQVVSSDLSIWNSELLKHFIGLSGVFHVAAKVEMSGNYSEFYQTNVIGTEHVIEYCRKAGVRNFVHTSSPSVVSCSGNLINVDESQPYPKKYLAYYPATKAIAERIVMRANREQFRAIILRPHLIFGPGDTSFIPTILKKARSGKIRVIGDGSNLVDVTYIDDCVQAHKKAMQALENNQHRGGKTYFISQGEPINFWDWINKVLVLNGQVKIEKKISKKLAYILATIAEGYSFLTNKEPLLTRFLVDELATDHYFNITAAKRDLGYCPSVSIDQALSLTFKS